MHIIIAFATDWLQDRILGNTLLQVLVASGILVVGCSLVAIFLRGGPIARWLSSVLAPPSERDSPHLGALLALHLRTTVAPVAYVLVLSGAVGALSVPPAVTHGAEILFEAALAFGVTRIAIGVAGYALDRYTARRIALYGTAHNLNALMPILSVTLWGIALLLLVENWGFKVTALIAGLGVGGVAIALAGQSVLKDAFGYVAIVVDRPFELGDFIVSGEIVGTIEQVGMKTTKIRSLSGEQLVLANSQLTDSLIHNYKRMAQRRIQLHFGVTYDTSAARLREIPGIVREIITGIDATRFDRAHFYEFGDSSLNFEVAYYVLSADYNVYMDVQQRINLELKEQFESRSIEFAFPTRTLYFANAPGTSAPARAAQPVPKG